MPKVPVDYSKTCIYKLVHFDDLNDENIYIGHTVNMVQRRHRHKNACNNPKDHEHNLPKYQFIRENGGWDNWEMILVEKYPCNSIDEAVARERYWKEQFKARLNTRVPGRTCAEWYQDNKERLKKKQKDYHYQNKEYRNENSIRKYHENKEEIKKYVREKITCECGSVICRDSMSKHRKSNKHQEWLKNNNVCTN